jgi:hypothetical protein
MASIIAQKLFAAGQMTGFIRNEGQLIEANFVVATEELLAVSGPAVDEGQVATREVEVGDFLAFYSENGETKRVHVPLAGLFASDNLVKDQFVIARPGTDEYMRFLGPHMLRARESLFVAINENPDIDANAQVRRLLGALQGSFERIQNEPEAFPAEALKDAFTASMIDAYGNAQLPVEPEAFLRKVRADALRLEIGRMEPGHPDALGRDPVGVDGILQNAGMEGAVDRGAAVRAPGGRLIGDRDMIRMLSANDRLCREVFGAATSTTIEDLSVKLLKVSEVEALREHFEQEDAIEQGEWVDEVLGRMRAITQGAMPRYQFEATIASVDGRDVLLVTDSVGGTMGFNDGSQGVGYLYSWPTADRRPTMEVNRGLIATFGAEDVPSEEELDRLERVRNELGARFDDDYGDDYDDDDFGELPEPVYH